MTWLAFDFMPLGLVQKVRRLSHACAHDFAIWLVPFALSNSTFGPSVLKNLRSHNTGTEAGASRHSQRGVPDTGNVPSNIDFSPSKNRNSANEIKLSVMRLL